MLRLLVDRETNGLCGNSHFFRRVSDPKLNIVARLRRSRVLDGHDGCVNTVSFTADGNRLISGSDDERIIIWDWCTGKQELSWDSGHTNNVFQARTIGVGKNTLVSCAADGQVRQHLISTAGDVKSKRIGKHIGRAHKLAIDPSSFSTFYSCGEDAAVRHYDLRMPNAGSTKILVVHSDVPNRRRQEVDLNSIHCNPTKPEQFVVGGDEEWAYVYDIRKIRPTAFVRALGTSPNAFVEPVEKYCPLGLRKMNRRPAVSITSAVFSMHGELLATYNDEDIYLFHPNLQGKANLGSATADHPRPRRTFQDSPTSKRHKVSRPSTPGAAANAAASTSSAQPQPANTSTQLPHPAFEPLPRRSQGSVEGTAPAAATPRAPAAAAQPSGLGEESSAEFRTRRQELMEALVNAHFATRPLPLHASRAAAAVQEPKPAAPDAGARDANVLDAAMPGSCDHHGSASAAAEARNEQAERGAAGTLVLSDEGKELSAPRVDADCAAVQSDSALSEVPGKVAGSEASTAKASAGSMQLAGAAAAAVPEPPPPQGAPEGPTPTSVPSHALAALPTDVDMSDSPHQPDVVEGGTERAATNDQSDSSAADDDDDDDNDDDDDDEEEEEDDEEEEESDDGGPTLFDRYLMHHQSDSDDDGGGSPDMRDDDMGAGPSACRPSVTWLNPAADCVVQRFSGHRNMQTIKGVNFMGQSDEYVVSGSDCGHVFIWSKVDGRLRNMMEGDEHVVNCLEPHPKQRVILATSGIDSTVKVWEPTGCREMDHDSVANVTSLNANRRSRAARTQLSTPMMLEALLFRTLLRRGRPWGDDLDTDEDDNDD